MFRKLLTVAAAAVLVVTTAGAAPAAVGGTDRPFRGSAPGTFNQDVINPLHCALNPMAPMPYTASVSALGQATHLGSFSVFAQHCEVVTGPGTGLSINGVMTLTAANGDTMKGTYTTVWAFHAGAGSASGTVDVRGDLVIDGGTGRFVHASGKLLQHHVISVTSQVPPWPLLMTFEGKVSY